MESDIIPIQCLILIILLLIIANGLIVLMNTAMNAVSRNAIKEMAEDDKNEKAIILQKILANPIRYRFTNKLLSYIFICLGLALSISLPYNPIITGVIYVLASISLGEYFTRKIAQMHSTEIALKFAGFHKFMSALLKPFVIILTVICDIFLKLFRQETDVEYSGYSEERVMSILEAGQQSGKIKEEGKKMINSIFEFDDELAYEIMTPRTDVFMIDINDDSSEYLDELMELKFSRIPVYEDDSDNIIGILHIKDFLIKAREDGFDKVEIKPILREPYLVPETKNIDSLFYEMQIQKTQIAILIDEYGGFSGIVTVEDIIEEIVGDIDDEYDEEEDIIKQLDENNYLVDGSVSLDDLDEETGIYLESENSETIGGFIIDLLGEIPQEGRKTRDVKFENYNFKILSVKERRIERIKLTVLENKTESDDNQINEKEKRQDTLIESK